MQDSKLMTFKAPQADIERWKLAADRDGYRSFSKWIRDQLEKGWAANRLPIEQAIVYKPAPVEAVVAVAEELRERAAKKASGSECLNRLPKGSFCTKCGRLH